MLINFLIKIVLIKHLLEEKYAQDKMNTMLITTHYIKTKDFLKNLFEDRYEEILLDI